MIFPRLPLARAAGLLLLLFVHTPAHTAGRYPISTITISPEPVAGISPLIYGINFNWKEVTARNFPSWNAALQRWAHYRLIHYPGGWNSEHYDWTSNQESRWTNRRGRVYEPATAEPRVDPHTLLLAVPKADFVTPSLPVVRNPGNLSKVVALSTDIVRKYGIGGPYGRRGVRIWDIGNEWWLQRGGKNHPWIRRRNLRRYAELVAAVVPAMKAADPTVQIFAGADWQRPEEFAALRDRVGARAWNELAGVSVHTYCGISAPPLCASIPAVMQRIRAISGKDRIFDSQWAVTRGNSQDDYGIKNANYLVAALRDIASSRMTGAIIWPVTGFVPALNFISPDYRYPFAPGLLFGWMSDYYEGEALATRGDIPAAAAKSDRGVTIVIPTGDIGRREIRIPLKGTGLSRVVSAKVLYSNRPDDPGLSRIVQMADLPTALVREAGDEAVVQFVVNPGTPGRGSNWEIARVTLR